MTKKFEVAHTQLFVAICVRVWVVFVLTSIVHDVGISVILIWSLQILIKAYISRLCLCRSLPVLLTSITEESYRQLP